MLGDYYKKFYAPYLYIGLDGSRGWKSLKEETFMKQQQQRKTAQTAVLLEV